MSRASAEPKSAPRLKVADQVPLAHDVRGIVAVTLQSMGMFPDKTDNSSPLDIMQTMLLQAQVELEAVEKHLEESNSSMCHHVSSLRARMYLAAEFAETLSACTQTEAQP